MTPTPKEKAKELVAKFENEMYIFESFDGSERKEASIKCALICVDEILNELKDEIWFSYCDDNNLDEREKFWLEVKQELTK